MNDRPFDDPQLQSLETRLAAAVPRISSIQQQQLLYQSAFAAGQTASRKSLRRWQASAAALVVLLLGLSVPAARDRWHVAEKKAEPFMPTEVTPQRKFAEMAIPTTARQSTTIELDAWQMQQPEGVSLADELAQIQQSDSHLRSLAVGTLTREVLQP